MLPPRDNWDYLKPAQEVTSVIRDSRNKIWQWKGNRNIDVHSLIVFKYCIMLSSEFYWKLKDEYNIIKTFTFDSYPVVLMFPIGVYLMSLLHHEDPHFMKLFLWLLDLWILYYWLFHLVQNLAISHLWYDQTSA